MDTKLHSLEGWRSDNWREGREKRDRRKEKISSLQVLQVKKRERGERELGKESKTHIPSGSVIKTGDNKYVMGAFSTKCGCLSFLEMGPQGDRPRKND